jgi:3-methylornithine--L-lysine ligase
MKCWKLMPGYPSQTPSVVYHATGINLMEELTGLFLGDHWHHEKIAVSHIRQVSYEHLRIDGPAISPRGEHVMGSTGPLFHKHLFCGADEVLTSYRPGMIGWVGTFINASDSIQELESKRAVMFQEIRRLQGEE